MNVFMGLFDEISSFDRGQFFNYIEPRLVTDYFTILQLHTLKMEPDVVDSLGSIRSCLEMRSVIPESWRDPEIFSEITSLLRTAESDSKCKAISIYLRRLGVHIGLTGIDEVMTTHDPPQTLRLACSKGSVFKGDGPHILELTDQVLVHLPPFNLYLPFSGLFNDVFSKQHYPPIDVNQSRVELVDLVKKGISLIESYSSDLAVDVPKSVRNIALTGNSGRPSFSYRLGYLGGVFINPSYRGGSPLAFAEALIHEYLHQRFWEWWAYEPLAGVVNPQGIITSPMTGQSRTVEVLFQALAIYANLIDFYAWAIYSPGLTREMEIEAKKRRRHLRSRIRSLGNQLEDYAGPNSAASKWIRIALELCAGR